MRVFRSPLKQFVFGIVGIILIAAAADVTFGHWLSTPPDTNNGAISTRGQSQQRGDMLWGGTMMVSGVLLFGGALTELVRRRPVIAVQGDGLQVGLPGGQGSAFIGWEDIDSVSSGVLDDTFDGYSRDQLIVEMNSGAAVPMETSAMVLVRNTLFIDAQDWATRVTEVALAAQGAHHHYRRVEALESYEPPSMVLEITVKQLPVEIELDSGTENVSEDDSE